ncbi:MAG: shikimate dehydrogenase [Acidimicrobiia bacterium]
MIGSPVRHSRSPRIHNAAFAAAELDWVYVALEVQRGRGFDAVRSLPTLGIAGINVTMPHKADAVRACDTLTETAAALGSVNTVVVNADGSTRGDSTDGEGFLRSIADAGVDVAGRSVLVLGAGGAARAVAAALVGSRAQVRVAARRDHAAAELADRVPGVEVAVWPETGGADAEVVVNATPIGMGSDATVPIQPRADQWVVDLVYHPVETAFLAEARRVGARPVGGLGMLVHQAALSFEQWTGVAAPLAAMFEAAS